MPYFKLPVTWESYGALDIEANNEEEFWELVKKYRNDNDDLPLPDAEYVDGSFTIADDETIKLLNESLQKKEETSEDIINVIKFYNKKFKNKE